MDYEGQICRAPMEKNAYMLPIRVGCTYNRCKFCNLFRHLTPRELPISQIKEELLRVKNLGGNPKKIFLGDGNAFDMDSKKLIEILELIHSIFQGEIEINSDATVTGILKKDDSELEKLSALGIKHLYIGIESGLDDVLEFMNKDHNITQAKEAISRINDYKMIYDAHIMTGVAGLGRGKENAIALAEFFKEYPPGYIVNFSMFIHEELPLYKHIESGEFIPSDEYDNLLEEKVLIENLSFEEGVFVKYEGFHDYIKTRVRGVIPTDKEKMIAKLKNIIYEKEDAKGVFSKVYGPCPSIFRSENDSFLWDI